MSLFFKPGLASAFLLSASIQTSAFLFSTVNRRVPTEKYYDLSGSLTNLTLAAQSLYVASQSSSPKSFILTANPRATLLASLSALWAIRLGSYLYLRIHRVGKDERFDDLKTNLVHWSLPWAFQAFWCFALHAPLTVLAANPVCPLFTKDLVSALVFIGGLTWESVADIQKSNWKLSHPNEPITSGLYKYSVYPNYWGESVLWWGAYFLAAPALLSPTQHLISMGAPLFTAFLLNFVSGIPLSEKSAWVKYGQLPGYIEYRARTSRLFPLPPSANISQSDLDHASQKAFFYSKTEPKSK